MQKEKAIPRAAAKLLHEKQVVCIKAEERLRIAQEQFSQLDAERQKLIGSILHKLGAPPNATIDILDWQARWDEEEEPQGDD